MSDITPYVGGGLTRDQRRALRSVSRYQAQTVSRTAAVHSEVSVSCAKIDGLATVTHTAMERVTYVALVRRALEQVSPEAAGDLLHLAQMFAIGAGNIAQDLQTALRDI